MKILFPIFGSEVSEGALEKIVELNPTKVIVLFVVDSNDSTRKPFGFMPSDINEGQLMQEDLKEWFLEKKIFCQTQFEWGNVVEKIAIISRREAIDLIALTKESNKLFYFFVEELGKKVNCKIQIFDE